MGYRKAILSSHGYEVAYVERPRFRGVAPKKLCIAVMDNVKYYAFRVCPPDFPEHYHRIASIQNSIPRMARIVAPIKDIVLIEEAHGRLLWDLDAAPDPDLVEGQLIEFALGTRNNQLVHGDLRPWNVFFDEDFGVQVIDWWSLSSFVDDLLPRGDLAPRRLDLLEGSYLRFHPDLVVQQRFTDIDQEDVKLIGRLLRGETELSDRTTWRGEYGVLGRFLWQSDHRL